jgi:sterol desaturase/sphingolipid hydroxylase (fatty acid hydroxylase superfamily)
MNSELNPVELCQHESLTRTNTWPRTLLKAGWLVVGVVSAFIAVSGLTGTGALEELLGPLKHHVPIDKALYSPLAYFCLLSLVFFLEQRIPAREQTVFTASFWQDVLWFFATKVFRVTFLGLYVSLLYAIYQQYLSFLTVEFIANWSAPYRFLTALLLADFLRWLSHLIRHKVSLFWSFHAVHHSQRNLNLFTDARVHPVDRMLSSTLRFIPMLALANDVPVILGWYIFETIYPKFYHANVRLNFGLLRYILVTPQSHRVHHAHAPAYQDKNFGFIFCIWDRLFGTHYEDDFDYPATGIADSAYPHEEVGGPWSQVRSFVLQLIYPFSQVFHPGRGRITVDE